MFICLILELSREESMQGMPPPMRELATGNNAINHMWMKILVKAQTYNVIAIICS